MKRYRSSKSKRKKTYALQSGLCFYCGKETSFEDWTIDHKDPRSRGGSNRDTNKVGSCEHCNKAKGNMSMAEFLETNYLSDKRRAILGNDKPPTIPYKTAKYKHNQRLGIMIRISFWDRIWRRFRGWGWKVSGLVDKQKKTDIMGP